MILRYITYIIKWGVYRLINYIIYPFVYINRKVIRENKTPFLWGFLHNSLDKDLNITDESCDYGDEYFYEKYFKGNSKLQMLLLSYKWSIRNPNHNWYYSNCIKGDQKFIESKTTSQRPVNDAIWRTLKYKDKNNIYKDKHGNYPDYKKSIIGKQWYVLSIGGVKYFRKSFANFYIIFGYLVCFEYKFGFENINWNIQFHLNIRKADDKMISEFEGSKL